MLRRRVGQTVVIGSDVTVTLMALDKYGQALLGIRAPGMTVARKELRLENEVSNFYKQLSKEGEE